MAQALSPIAIADDGDLDDVRRLLHRLDLPFFDASIGPVPPESLRISNPRCALDAMKAAEDAGFHIVVLDEDSAPLRRELRGGTFDFIVQRPVHPAALRLLILHGLYSGPERRARDRVAMDAEVKIGGRLRQRSARLTQLSERGCGLLASGSFEVGDRAVVVFPKSFTGDAMLRLHGRVAAVEPSEGESAEFSEVAVVFRPPSAAVRRQIWALMASRGIGAAALHPRRADEETPDEPSSETAAASGERRSSPRKLFRRPVLASATGGVHTLVGRDLSTGGMRVAADARLEVGQEFKLVVYGNGVRAPLLIKAVVARNDGEDGCVLRFQDVSASAAAWLEETVGALPQLAGSPQGPNLVLSEIIDA